MKKLIPILLVILFLSILNACKAKPEVHQHGTEASKQEVDYYTCSMHPWVHSKEPGTCPACGMKLVPVYREEATGPVDSTKEAREVGPEVSPPPDLGRAAVRLSSEKQQLIGVRTEEVRKQLLVREIDAAGRVAYDPDLYVAQSEYLVTRRVGAGDLGGLQGGLVRAARSRLQLLGMSDAQIRDLERSGRPQGSLVIPQKGEGVWVYGSLFESELPWVKVGMPVEVLIPGSREALSSDIASLDPTINPQTRSAQFRVKVSNPEGKLRPDMYVKLKVRADAGQVLAVPTNALMETGKRTIVFVEASPGKFEPVEVQTGKRGTGYTEVISGLQEGQKVVTNGNFLIDSESSLKATLGGGGHQH